MATRTQLYRWYMVLLLALPWLRPAAQPGAATIDTPPAKLKSLFSIGGGVQHGFIFAHSEAVENTRGSNPTGVEVILGWQRNDAAAWALCNCFPRRGLLLAYYDYDNSILGRSYTAAYFLEPVYRLGKRVAFSFQGAAGLSYLTHPFDSIRNPANRSYSTALSAYLLLGAGIWFQVGDRWSVRTGVSYQHESNGGLRQPNKGINWPTAGLAVAYQTATRPYYTGGRRPGKYWSAYTPRWDLGLFGMGRRTLDAEGNSRRLPLAGIMAGVARQVGRIHTLTGSAEVYRDEELHVQLKRDSIRASPVKAGVLAGHEFILGRFLLSQRLGLYVFDQTPYYDRLYHRWGLLYRANRRLGIGFNLQAHRQVADYVDFRITYSWQRVYR